MADSKLKFPRATSPKGIAQFPWLNIPDKKFNAAGVFSTKLLLPLEEAQPLMDALDEMAEQVYQRELSKRKPADQKKKPLIKAVPYAEVLDDDGNETGQIAFAFKLNAKVEVKPKGDKPGTILEFKPKFFDAKGTVMELAPKVYGGSIIRINYEPTTYMVAGTSTCGISLRIYGVQVIKLVSGGSSNETARDMGFGEEEGYVADNFDNNAAGNDPVDRGSAEDF